MHNEPLPAAGSPDIDQWLHGRPIDFLAYLQRVFADTDLGDPANDVTIGAIQVA